MKRTLIRTAALLVSALALTACAAQTPEPTAPSPTTGSATAQPSASVKPTQEAMPTENTSAAQPQGVEDADTARRASEELKDELEQLSEVTDAKVVIAGNQAAIALTFDAQYQAGVTDRIKDMVKERMDGVISGVKRIAVTDDAAMMERITELADQLENATDLTEIENKLSALINQMEDGGASPSMTDTSGEA